MKKYGVIYADGGANIDMFGWMGEGWDYLQFYWFLDHWPFSESNWEVVQTGTHYCAGSYYETHGNVLCPTIPAIPTGAAPTISAFTANDTSITLGESMTLSWTVSGAGSRIRFL